MVDGPGGNLVLLDYLRYFSLLLGVFWLVGELISWAGNDLMSEMGGLCEID